MQFRRSALLLHPLFLVSLLLLLANDHWWKQAYGNVLTGKLSDFTGVFVWAVLLMAILPFRKIPVLLFAALSFVWWKSPLSEPFLNWVASFTGLQPARVIDYTDLTALCVLPAAYYLKQYEYFRYGKQRQIFISAVGIISVFACMATSVSRMPNYYYPPGRVWVYKSFKTRLTEEQFLRKLDSLRISFRKDSVEYLPVYRDSYYLRIKNGDDTSFQWVPLQVSEDTMLYYRKELTNTYVIPEYILENDTITNVQFTITAAKKKRKIEVVSMTLPHGLNFWDYDKPHIRKKYFRIAKALMLEMN